MAKELSPATPPSTDERKARISVLLRQIDSEIKNKSLDKALELTLQVYQYDPRNLYARAFEERILVMKSDIERAKTQAEASRVVQESVRVEVKQPPPPIVEKRVPEVEVKQPSPPIIEKRVLEVEKKQPPPPTLEKRVFEVEKEFDYHPPLSVDVREIETSLIPRTTPSPFDTLGINPMEEIERHLLQRMNVMLEEKQRQMEDDFQRRIQGMQSQPPPGGNYSQMHSVQQLQINNIPVFMKTQEQQEEELQNRLTKERRQLQEEITRQFLEEQRQSEEALIERITRKFQTELKLEKEKAHQLAITAYCSALSTLIKNKVPKAVLQAVAEAIRAPLFITNEENVEIERTAQITAYTQELRECLSTGTITPSDAAEFEKLQQMYSISESEHKSLLRKVKRELGLPDDSAIILIIDDDPEIRELMNDILHITYQTVITVEDVETALPLIEMKTPDIIICDVGLPGIGGFTFFEGIKQGVYDEAIQSTPFVFTSGLGDQYFIREAKRLGAKSYLVKPFSPESLEETVKQALK